MSELVVTGTRGEFTTSAPSLEADFSLRENDWRAGLAKGRHNLLGEQTHGFLDFFVRDAAEVEGRG